jgi:hypothetical protein
MSNRNLSLFCFLFFLPFIGLAQYSLEGKVIDAVTNQPIPDAEVNLLPGYQTVVTGTDGKFLIRNITEGIYSLTIRVVEHEDFSRDVVIEEDFSIGTIEMDWVSRDAKSQVTIDDRSSADNMPTLVLSESDFDDDLDGGQDISGILTASRDVFISAAAYNWSAARFRIRGLNSENSRVLINGAPINNLENNFVFWGLWGGLNDMFRLREVDVGMGSIDYAFGGMLGANQIDTRPSRQRANTRVSYAASNRTYRNRIMVTHNTGILPSGWSFSVSMSRRWAQEGYIPGTSYNNYAYFLGAEKQINDKHAISVTAFGSPIRRGNTFPGTDEMYELAGTNYYNSNWGWQDGAKRNSRMRHTNQPVGIIRHDWTMNEGDFLTTTVSGRAGSNGSTALNWFDKTRDPRPSFYRKLPSSIDNPEAAQKVAEYLSNNPDQMQVDWDHFYDVNRNSPFTVENANGVDGNTINGNIGRYIIEDRRYDSRQFAVRSLYNNTLSPNWTLQIGAQFEAFQSDNYKLIDDLLGADYWLDVDRFLLRNFSLSDETVSNDLSTPNKVVRQGDRFEYSYKGNGRRAESWGQVQYSGSRWEAFAAAKAGYNSFWRDGEWANGKFPDNSQGRSEKAEFITYGFKAGATYKFDGRNYLYVNAMVGTDAPTFRYSFVSPRTRNSLIPDLTTQKMEGIEGGYVLRSPYLKARFTGYIMNFRDQYFNRSFFLDVGAIGNQSVVDSRGQSIEAGFVNYIMSGIDKRHMGIEAALEWQLLPALSVNAATSLGSYTYTSRPEATIVLDPDETFIDEGSTVYLKNFFQDNVPQTAAMVGLSYRSPNYWFLNLNLNYYDHIYLGMNPDRRRGNAVSGVEPGSELYQDIVHQEKAPSAMTLDLFGGKSFRFGGYFLYLNVGVNNILNNKNIVTGGFEQYRFEYAREEGDIPNVDRFPNNKFYMFGLNYFVSATLRI